jgi:hypothetical protein
MEGGGGWWFKNKSSKVRFIVELQLSQSIYTNIVLYVRAPVWTQ